MHCRHVMDKFISAVSKKKPEPFLPKFPLLLPFLLSRLAPCFLCPLFTERSMLGNVLTPSKVFTSLTLFNQLRLPLFFFPATLNAFAEAKVRPARMYMYDLYHMCAFSAARTCAVSADFPELAQAPLLVERQTMRRVD